MEKLYTREEIDIFRSRKALTKKMKIDDWKEQTAYWKKRTEALVSAYVSNPYGERLRELTSLGKTLSGKS